MEHLEWIQDGFVLLEPIQSASSFTSEHHKYERKALAKDDKGRTVVFDDSDSIDFTIGTKNYSIVPITKILAILKEEDNGQTNS